jgi:hypothetical protein
MLICVVECYCVVYHSGTGLGVGNVVGLLVGSNVCYKTPAARRSRDLRPAGAHWEIEGVRVVEELGWGTSWCCTPANGAWEDGLVHAAREATHCVGACCCTLVIFTWASTCTGVVVVVHLTAMHEAVVPVLELFCQQGGEAAWGLMSDIAAAVFAIVAATVATATPDVATANCIAATIVAATTNVVFAATTASATVAAAVVVTTLLAATASTPWALWLLLQGLAGADCLA